MTTKEQGTATNTGRVYLYFGPLTLLVYLVVPHGYLLDIATSFMLKNQLHATAWQVTVFRLVTAIPVYLSIVFGFMRDIWNPFGIKDRGFFLIFGPLTAVIFLWLALSHLSYDGMIAGMFLVMATFRFVAAAHQGLIALIGQEQLMSGRLAVLWQILGTLPYVVGAFAAGFIAEYVRPRETFLLMTILSLLFILFGLWKPKAVFGHAYDKPAAKGAANILEDIKRLLRHRAVYPAVIIMFMFQFSPGANTPLQYYLSNTLHAPDSVYGLYYAIFAAAFIPVWFIYGYICKFVSLEKLLWLGTILTVPQMIPLIFIHSGSEAVFWALPMGLAGGVAGVAYFDLAMRSCPPGLQGTLMMMVDGMYQLSYRGGDMLGVKIYESSPTNGFLYCVIATTAVYALMLPMLLLIPKNLIATKDGEHNIEMEAGQTDERAAVTATT